jgi:tRNA modification GTPase
MGEPRETITAMASGAVPAAIAVIRLSGPATAEIVAAVAGALPPPRRASLRRLVDPRTGAAIDRGLVLWFPGPASPTGEDAAELHLHGGRAVVAAMLDALVAQPGVRLAEPGEFARRAFLAGLMDLAALEGLADLVAAETEAQRAQALAHAEGMLGDRVEAWRERLVAARALIEAGLDFADEDDVPAEATAAARAAAAGLAADLRAALGEADRGERLRDGFRVALIGPPNAGKSTLLNALARRDVAIVAAEPGTTRDVIEVHLDLAGLPVTVADTAGLRDAAGGVEEEGIRRALARARAGDLVLWLDPADAPADAPAGPPPVLGGATVLRVSTKADLAAGGPAEAAMGAGPHEGSRRLRVSALTGEGLDRLVAEIGAAAGRRLRGGEPAVLVRARQREAVAAALEALDRALAEALPAELVAEELRLAGDALGRVTGRVGVEDVLDRLFSSFCIGK